MTETLKTLAWTVEHVPKTLVMKGNVLSVSQEGKKEEYDEKAVVRMEPYNLLWVSGLCLLLNSLTAPHSGSFKRPSWII